MDAQDARVCARMIIASALDGGDVAVLFRLASMAGADLAEVNRLLAAASELAAMIRQPWDRLVIRRS